jgi:hypothetical protein
MTRWLDLLVLVALTQPAFAQSSGWVLWSHSETHQVFGDDHTKSVDRWNVIDAFEGFVQCKKNTANEISRAAKNFKLVASPSIENAGASFSHYKDFTEKEQLLAYEQSLKRPIKDGLEAAAILKLSNTVKTVWGNMRYICLPGGTDPRSRSDEK